MRLLKRVFDFYLNSNIHVALAVCALCYVTLLTFDIEPNTNLILFVFFATVSGYNFVKYFGLARFHHRSLANWLKYIQVFSFFCFVALCVIAFKIKLNTLFLFAITAIITFFYAIPFLPRKLLLDERKNLRAISGLKIYVIALVWAIVTVMIPVLDAGYEISNDLIITALQRFLFVVLITLPFEIRDLRYDSLKLATIPQCIGVKNTKIAGIVLAFIIVLVEFLKDELYSDHLIIMFVVLFVSVWLLWFSTVNQRKYYSAFWVEGIPILWLLLMLL